MAGNFSYYIYLVPGILAAMTLHEYAHGWVSWKLGDPTPEREGRLSFNPLHHVDPFGALCMLLFRVGWAKPVMVNPRYYKDPKKGVALVSAAGPAVNLVTGALAVFIAALMEVLAYTGRVNVTGSYRFVYNLVYYFSMLSINLGIFNLIPLPPLDGSKILAMFLPDKVLYYFSKYQRYFMIALLVGIYLGFLSRPLSALYSAFSGACWNLAYKLLGGLLTTAV
ncbi:MAG: site-2 protease family protein [Lachnospiraceae bacterium]